MKREKIQKCRIKLTALRFPTGGETSEIPRPPFGVKKKKKKKKSQAVQFYYHKSTENQTLMCVTL